ncbi:MAG: hypothetical protein JXN64_06465, partial [Spirochaetes bacterium]|nr:hypothetical protein [Spirochaetota bacterium]
GTIQYVEGGTIQYVEGGTIQYVEGGTIQSVEGGTIQYVRGGTIQYVWGGTIQYVWGNSVIQIYNNITIQKVLQNAIIICNNCTPNILKKSDSVQIIKTNNTQLTKNDFLDIYSEQIKDNQITLYKSVNPETECDFYTGKIKYEGIVKPEKWNPDEQVQCGDGLHLSPLPQLALNYNKGKLKICKVNIDNFVVYPDDITKVRCSEVEVIEDYKE